MCVWDVHLCISPPLRLPENRIKRREKVILKSKTLLSVEGCDASVSSEFSLLFCPLKIFEELNCRLSGLTWFSVFFFSHGVGEVFSNEESGGVKVCLQTKRIDLILGKKPQGAKCLNSSPRFLLLNAAHQQEVEMYSFSKKLWGWAIKPLASFFYTYSLKISWSES